MEGFAEGKAVMNECQYIITMKWYIPSFVEFNGFFLAFFEKKSLITNSSLLHPIACGVSYAVLIAAVFCCPCAHT